MDSALEREAYARGRRRWPNLPLRAEDFLVALRRHPAPASGVLHGEDLYLAIACGLGSAPAQAALERLYIAPLAASLRTVDGSAVFIDEVLQHLRQKLLVSLPGERPRILAYAGHGPLGAWMRMTALRIALDLHRRSRAGEPLEEQRLQQWLSGQDPELESIRAEHRAELRTALRAAFGRLTQRDRNILRLQLIDGLSVDRIARLYGAHRATLTRWLSAARVYLLEETKRELYARLRVSTSELESILDLARSQLDISLSPLFHG